LNYFKAPKGLNVRYVSKPVILILNSNAERISKRHNPILLIVNSITKVTGRSLKAGAVAALIVLPIKGNAINRLPDALAVCVSDCDHGFRFKGLNKAPDISPAPKGLINIYGCDRFPVLFNI
jgi:hypothetical protein